MRVGWGRGWKIAMLSTQLKITTHSALNISQESDFWRSVISLDEFFFFLEPIFLLLFWTFQVRKIKRTGHHLSEGGEGGKEFGEHWLCHDRIDLIPPSPPPRLCMTPLSFIGSKLTDTPSAPPKTHVISPKILHTPSPLSKGTKKDWYLRHWILIDILLQHHPNLSHKRSPNL